MALNDDLDEFNTELQDEDTFDAHPPPGTELLGMAIQRDIGSGSYAEDGRLEVAEDRVMMNGEDQVGSAAMFGPSEIGAGAAADRDGFEIGAGLTSEDGQSELGDGLASEDGASEVGLSSDVMVPFESFMLEEDRMGEDDEVGAGAAADRDGSELGSAAMYGPTEIGEEEFDSGYAAREGESEIGAAAAVARVIEKARDNRQPPPPMRAVDVDAPVDEDDFNLTDIVLGAAAVAQSDPFPLTSRFLQRAGAASEPRIVRVDTEESYKAFRAENSPELQELRDRLEAHEADPAAHDLSNDLSDDIDDLVHLGAAADAAEEEKRIDLWMPKRFDGLLTAWREGDHVCASITLPGRDGEVRICTSLEPVRRCVDEMARHATEANVSAATVVGALPAMGCVLGAGTVIKELAAAAPSILARPEAAQKVPFMVRIEPKLSPAIAALMMLAASCRAGNAQACDEWKRLGQLSAGPVKQAMLEALELVKAVTG